jgi:hypothetical protein
VAEDEHLVLPRARQDLLVADFVHEGEAANGLLLRDADVLLLQGHGPKGVVEEEEPGRGVHA